MVARFPCENIVDALIVQPSFEIGPQAGLLDAHSQAQLSCIVKLVVCGMLPLSVLFLLPDMISSALLNQSCHPLFSGNQLIRNKLRQLRPKYCCTLTLRYSSRV